MLVNDNTMFTPIQKLKRSCIFAINSIALIHVASVKMSYEKMVLRMDSGVSLYVGVKIE